MRIWMGVIASSVMVGCSCQTPAPARPPVAQTRPRPTVSTTSPAVETPEPRVDLVANGTSELVSYRGWPLSLDLVITHPDPRGMRPDVPATFSISGAGPWIDQVRIRAFRAGDEVSFPLTPFNAPSSASTLLVSREEGAALQFFMLPNAGLGLGSGSYRLIAELRSPSAPPGSWDGAARSNPLDLDLRDEPAPLPAELKDVRVHAFAMFHLRRDELDAAEQLLSARLAEDPSSIDALAYKSELELQRGDRKAAAAAYRAALHAYVERHPHAQEPPMHLFGRLSELQGNFERPPE